MFWDIFVALCAERGESPSPTAIKIGFSNAAATHWKKGKIPRGESLKKIADYFGVSTNYLLGKTDKKEKPTTDTGDGLSKQFANLFSQLSPEQQEFVVSAMKGLKSKE